MQNLRLKISRSTTRLLATGAMVALTLTSAIPAHAAFHLWEIREVYSDASGTNQFIEFFSQFGSQQFVGGQSITVSSGGTNNVFTIPSHLPGDSTSKAFLVGTASITNFGAPKPDFVIPNNFIFKGGGTLTFFVGSGPYTALPTNGILSRTWVGGTDATNSPRNFAGQTGTIVLPAVNTPPAISITAPANNANFSAGEAVPVTVNASDDGSVANVRLLTNGVLAASNAVAPFSFTLNNLAPGNYTLRAIAQDNTALTATSGPVTFHVLSGLRVTVAPSLGGPLQLQFPSSNGFTYIIERASPLTNFVPIRTNPGGGTITFTETNGGPSQQSYRVRIQ